jgi:hypothetical protein
LGEGLDWIRRQKPAPQYTIVHDPDTEIVKSAHEIGGINVRDADLRGLVILEQQRVGPTPEVGDDKLRNLELRSGFAASVVSAGDLLVGVTNRVDVLAPGLTPGAGVLEKLHLKELDQKSGWMTFELPDGADREKIYEELQAHPDIKSFDPELIFWKSTVQRLPERGNLRSSIEDIFAAISFSDALKAQLRYDENVRVAVVDGGIDHRNVLFQDTPIEYFDSFRSNQPNPPRRTIVNPHGTRCAGILAAVAPALGLCSGVHLVDCHSVHSTTGAPDELAYSTHMWRTFEWLLEQPGVRVVNISLSMPPHARVTQALEQLARNGGGGQGVVICAASGNSGGGVAYPARIEEIILAVGGCDLTGAPIVPASGLGWANGQGSALDLLAPAIAVPTADLSTNLPHSSGWTHFDRTSCATPIVSSVAAMCFATNPSLDADSVRRILRMTAGDGSTGEIRQWSDERGFGSVHAARAIEAASQSRIV